MSSLTPGSDSKKSSHPGSNKPLDSKGQKQARQFAKGVKRFLRYNKDLLPEETYDHIASLGQEFVDAIPDSKRLRKDFEKMADNISKTCKKAIPDFQPSLIRENIEVLFVAVVIAMGIRAYFIQQFKIPTGSMQPTLNGIIAYPADELASPNAAYKASAGYEKPNPVARLIDSIWFGRSHVEWRAREDGDSFLVTRSQGYQRQGGLVGRNKFILFPRTYLTTRKGNQYVAAGTASRVTNLINWENNGKTLKKGDLIARGYLETGDMLIVNKMIYHWRKPKRGEVFVFNTRDIDLIQRTINPAYGSQHYIKRLCGLPGDHIVVDSPNLIVNGEPAREFGIRRVMSGEGLYHGYLNKGLNFDFQLEEGQYLALGDNSGNSLDSRSWGHVPQNNIVGKALFVFYPFGNHFGPIK